MNNFFLRLLTSLIITPVFLFAIYKGNIYFYLLLIFLFFTCSYEIIKNIKQLVLIFFLLFIICFFLYSFYFIRVSHNYNFIIFIWILSIVWITDISGYIVGKIIGGSKLSIYSPNKTLSGFFGSIFFSQLSFLIPLFYLETFIFSIKILLIQFILCLVSVFGDLFFSFVKRINNIKDYSNIIPGHGGILDRIDGMIFVTMAYYFIMFYNVI